MSGLRHARRRGSTASTINRAYRCLAEHQVIVRVEDRPQRWRKAVQRAQINHSEVSASTGQPWEPKDALGRDAASAVAGPHAVVTECQSAVLP
ncbi:MAG: hypothetical protein ACRDRX_07300 [Pseudonocardiaceae bacterium]